MIDFILNDQTIRTDLPTGMTVLDFVRYRQDLKGTKIGCREGDCGACTILVGELTGENLRYRSMTSCLMPLANAAGKHIVTIEGINPEDGSLTPVQQAMVEESGTQCGFCTVGFVMSLTGFCLENAGLNVSSPTVREGAAGPIKPTPAATGASFGKPVDAAISAIDGNICRCTGYKSIERAAERVCKQLADGSLQAAPPYFADIPNRLTKLNSSQPQAETRAVATVPLVGGGTDVYVQKPEYMAETESRPLLYDDRLRGIRDVGQTIEIGASATVTDLLESETMQAAFPDLYKHLKLVSSTPIRNMATLAGNFVNASPIGDMTVWFLALDANIVFDNGREMPLRKLYLGYKRLAKTDTEYIAAIRFRKPGADHYFNFEKVCKRTYLDIATVNTAISLRVESTPGPGWTPPALSKPGAIATGSPHSATTVQNNIANPNSSSYDLGMAAPTDGVVLPRVEHKIIEAHVSAGGVAPIPLYLTETSAFLTGMPVNAQTLADANQIMQAEISPISDVRGTAEYKRLLLRQLFRAHFYELFGE
jgi:xanthine dehydrogenase small subunit